MIRGNVIYIVVRFLFTMFLGVGTLFAQHIENTREYFSDVSVSFVPQMSAKDKACVAGAGLAAGSATYLLTSYLFQPRVNFMIDARGIYFVYDQNFVAWSDISDIACTYGCGEYGSGKKIKSIVLMHRDGFDLPEIRQDDLAVVCEEVLNILLDCHAGCFDMREMSFHPGSVEFSRGRIGFLKRKKSFLLPLLCASFAGIAATWSMWSKKDCERGVNFGESGITLPNNVLREWSEVEEVDIRETAKEGRTLKIRFNSGSTLTVTIPVKKAKLEKLHQLIERCMLESKYDIKFVRKFLGHTLELVGGRHVDLKSCQPEVIRHTLTSPLGERTILELKPLDNVPGASSIFIDADSLDKQVSNGTVDSRCAVLVEAMRR